MSAVAALTVIWGVNFALVAFCLYGPGPRPGPWWLWFTALNAAAGLAFSLVDRDCPAAGFCVATLVMLGRDWWKRRGRKAAKAVGAKSRAVLAAVVARAREAGTPVPQGARA